MSVENQTEQVLTMRVDGNTYFKVLPHQKAKGETVVVNYPPWLVEAINEDNEINFGRFPFFCNCNGRLCTLPTSLSKTTKCCWKND